MPDTYLQKMLADYIVRKGGVSTKQFEWTRAKEEEFDSIPIEDLIDDPYFLNQKDELFPEHRDDIVEFFTRKMQGEDLRMFLDSEAIRSGKTHKAAVMAWIVMFKNIIKYDFREHYSHIGKDYGLAILFTSRDDEKAKDVTFEKVLPLFLNSGFFQDYFPPDVTMKEVEEMKRKPDRLRFPHRMLLFTQSGMLGELGALGHDLIYGVIDEVNFFPVVKDSKRGVVTSDGVFDAADELVTSVITRIGAQFIEGGIFPPFAGVHALSARRGKLDYLERECQANKGNPQFMIRKRALWEAKPRIWRGKTNYCGKTFEFDTDELKATDLREAALLYKKQFGRNVMNVEVEDIANET